MDERITTTKKRLSEMRIKYTMAFAEWIGENKITYDGYKIWTRDLRDVNRNEDSKPVCYNTEQLIEQYFREAI